MEAHTVDSKPHCYHFETDDDLKKRIVYDCTALGVNPHLTQHAEMSLPTILRLLQSMGNDYFMAKSDLKDMFYNFPVRQADWTF